MQRRSDELNHSRCESGKSGRGSLLCGGRECRLALSEGNDATAFTPIASRRTNGVQRTALSVVQRVYSPVRRYARWVRTSCLASGPNSQALPRRSPRRGERCEDAKNRVQLYAACHIQYGQRTRLFVKSTVGYLYRFAHIQPALQQKATAFFPLTSPVHQTPNAQRHERRTEDSLAAMTFA